jgi:site-specific DNA-methyltransferase (adenine-specific)
MSEEKKYTLEELKIELVQISLIKLNPNNPRVIKDDKFNKLVESIKNFPEMLKIRPIVVNSDMIVLGGNMRLKACKEAGLKEVPVIKAETLTEEQQRKFISKDNVGFGEWDWEMLANEWDSEELEEWGLDIADNWKDETKAVEDNYEIPDEIETDIVLGDLIEIGEHRLLCGDSTQTETFDKLFDGQMADMVITDPPYNVDYTGKTKDALKIENDKKTDSDFYQFLWDFYTAQSTVCKTGSAWYVWHADSEGANFRSAMADAGIMVKQCLIWVKNAMVMGRQDYHWQHEPCLYGWKEGAAHGWYSDRKQTTVLEFDRPNRNAEHPTMKPIPLFAYQIGNSSKQGDIVADAFGGSGTTMVACQQMNRKAYIVEFDPKYCQVIIDRMIALDDTLKIKINGKEYHGV